MQAYEKAAAFEEQVYQAYAQEEVQAALARGATNVVPLLKAAAPVNKPPTQRVVGGVCLCFPVQRDCI